MTLVLSSRDNVHADITVREEAKGFPRRVSVEAQGGWMKDLPNLPRVTAPTTARRLATAAATFIATLLVASCSHSTGGTATPGHSSAPVSAPASAPHPSAVAAPTTSAPESDEDQAKDTVKAFGDAYNSQNWEAYTELMCAAMRAQFTGIAMDYVKNGRINNGPTTMKSVTVAIDGDTGTATINGASEALGPGSITMPLKREDGWKVCQLTQH
jgi:hypothetical protein